MNKANSGSTETVKDKSVAVIKGTENIVETTVDSTGHIIGTAIKDTAQAGGEVGTAATGLATGAIKDVEKVGVKAEHATAAVAGGRGEGGWRSRKGDRGHVPQAGDQTR